MKKVKLVYQDNKTTKVIFGIIESEDSMFITIVAEDNTKFRLNKYSIISIKELKTRVFR